jgi:hypothetical protein
VCQRIGEKHIESSRLSPPPLLLQTPAVVKIYDRAAIGGDRQLIYGGTHMLLS